MNKRRPMLGYETPHPSSRWDASKFLLLAIFLIPIGCVVLIIVWDVLMGFGYN